MKKETEYISEFIGQAYANTTYVALPYPKIEKIEEGLSKSFDFTVLGQRAGFFLSGESRAAIDSLTKNYYRALVEFSQQKSKEKHKGPQSWEEYYKDYVEELNNLASRLRAEIQGKASLRHVRRWPRPFIQNPLD